MSCEEIDPNAMFNNHYFCRDKFVSQSGTINSREESKVLDALHMNMMNK